MTELPPRQQPQADVLVNPNGSSLRRRAVCEVGGYGRPDPRLRLGDELRQVVKRISHYDDAHGGDLEQPAFYGPRDLPVDLSDGLRPGGHVQRTEGPGLTHDRRLWRNGLGVDQDAAVSESVVNPFQSVDHARDRHTSERPAAERDVEAPPRQIELLRAVHPEAHAAA